MDCAGMRAEAPASTSSMGESPCFCTAYVRSCAHTQGARERGSEPVRVSE